MPGLLIATALLAAPQALAGVAPGEALVPIDACRAVDTRSFSAPALAAGETRLLTLTGSCGIPSTALTLAVNLTAVTPAAVGFAELYAGDLASAPGTSVLNFNAGVTRAGNAIVDLPSDNSGTVKLGNVSTGATHYLLDVVGYFIPACTATITVTNPGTTTGSIGVPFSGTFTSSGGTGTSTFTTASPLPAGLTLAANGVLSGTPTNHGSFPIVVTATDANGCTGSGATYTLVIACQTITVTNPATTTGTANAPFSQTFTQTGGVGTTTFTTASTLPAGLTLAANGVLSGTPTQTGSFPITVTATDADGCTGTGPTYTLVISCQTITVTNPATTTGTAGTPFSQTFTQTGAIGSVTFLTASTLPAGMSLATNGTLSGTPTQTGVFPIVVTATDSNGCNGSSATYTLVIGCQAITVTNPIVTTGTVNAAFSQTFTQAGAIGSATFTTASTLPAGISLATNGALSGIPTQAGSFPIVVTVTDGNGCTGTSATYNLVILCQSFSVGPASLPQGTANVVYPSVAFTQTGGVGTVTFSESGTLPLGMGFSIDTLSGTPTQTGSFPVTITATDSNGCTTKRDYLLVVVCSGSSIVLSPPSLPAVTVNSAFTPVTFTATGGTSPYAFAEAGALPSGMSFVTDTLSGTPTETGSFPITISVTDANGCAGSQDYVITVICNGVTVTVAPPTIPSGPAGTAYGPVTFTAGGSTGPYVLTETGALPSGMAFVDNGDGTATLSGTPVESGTFPIVVTAKDANGCVGSTNYSLVITCPVVTVTNPSTTTGTVNTPFSETFTQSGGANPITFTLASGSLPAGLTLAADGTLSGTPTESGTFNITVKATDSNGCEGTGATFSLVISCQTITVTNPGVTTGVANTAFSQTFTAGNAVGTTTFTTASTLPAGLSLSTAGVLSGTPTQTGSFPIVVTVTDANGCTGTGVTYTLVISCQTITVTNPATATGTVDAAFSQTFTASNAIGTTTFTLASGTLPSGLTLATNGTLSGTPGQSGSFPITVMATDANGCTGTSATYNLVIACQTITVTNPGVTTGTVDAAFSQTFTQVGVGTHTPATFTTSSTLPSGMTLSTAGVLSGTPGQPGTFPIVVTVTDANGCTGTSATYNLVIACQTITVTNPGVTTGTVDAAFSQTFTQVGVGTHTPATFTLASGTLPTGLSLSTAGVLSGTPSQPGSFPITVKVTDANGCTGTSATYTLVVACQTITVTNPVTATGTVDAAFSQTFTQVGVGTHTPATFTTSSTLPSGLTLSTAGVLSGTPGQPGSFPIVVTVTDANGCTGTGATYTLVIACQTITVNSPATTLGIYNSAFSQAFTAGTGGSHTPLTFTLNSGALPAGLTLATNGTLSGTPTQTGNFPITVKVTDANGCTGTSGTYALAVGPNLVAEAYTTIGNTQLRGGVAAPATPSVDGGVGVGSNDTSDTTITYALFSGPTLGTLPTFNTNGTFLYTPAVGNNTSATFVYSGTSNGVTVTQTTTVNFNSRVWWVDNTNGATADGRSNTPFATMAQANVAATVAGDFIYVFKGSGTTTGAYTMKASQKLIGAGATLNVASGLLIITGLAGNTPTLGGTVTLASSVTVDGIDMATTSSTALAGGSVTGISVNVRTLTTTTGTAISVTGSGNTGSMTFTTVNAGTSGSGAPAKGITVSNFTGTFTVNGTGGSCDNTTPTCTGGTIQKTSGNGAEFINVTNAGSTSVTLKNMNLTTNGQSQAVAGSSTACGGDLRTGNNLSCVADLMLQGSSGISLDKVRVVGSGQMGINGNDVTTLAISNSTITGNGNEVFEDGLTFQNLKGTCSITDSMIKDNAARQIVVSNIASSSTLTLSISGTRTNNAYPTKDTSTTEIGKTTQTDTFTDQSLLFDTVSTATNVSMTLNLTGVVFNNSLPGNSVLINPIAGAGSSIGGTTNNCSFDTTAGGVIIQAQNSQSGTYNVTNSEFNRVNLQSILYAGANPYAGSLQGTVSGNIIGTAGQAGSACEPLSSTCNGVQLNFIGGSGSIATRIQSNTIQEFGGIGIRITANGVASPDLSANIVSNTIQNPAGLIAHGMDISIGTTASANVDGCLGITGNTVTGTYEDPGAGTQFGIVTNVRFLSFFKLPGYGGSGTAVGGPGNAVTDYIIGNNTTAGKVFTQRSGSGAYPGGAACATP